MDLTKPSRENISYIMNRINEKLRVVNTGVLNPDLFDTDLYEELLEIYQMIDKKDRFSISEQEAIVTELGRLRKG